ncbi:MAG: hypothetical protein COT84_02385 [Chlamydiae bacterium CG10_big_fil_rev_8_21_14_0_10_35_9]|nr:MAG: hypothetical protein COT84_02385 [Chlamydiae bacterium CG10_big_fil_rev_8_21_14_0_10_35_9]
MRYIFLLLLITSCATKSNWHLSQIDSQEVQYRSSRFVYHPDKYCDLELELVCYQNETKAFINLLHEALIQENNKPILLTFTIDGTSYEGATYLLKGGQRLQISEPLTDKLINSLQQGKEISIILNSSQLDIDPGNFTKIYAKRHQTRNSIVSIPLFEIFKR